MINIYVNRKLWTHSQCTNIYVYQNNAHMFNVQTYIYDNRNNAHLVKMHTMDMFLNKNLQIWVLEQFKTLEAINNKYTLITTA